jgi:hypothetical protein
MTEVWFAVLIPRVFLFFVIVTAFTNAEDATNGDDTNNAHEAENLNIADCYSPGSSAASECPSPCFGNFSSGRYTANTFNGERNVRDTT